MSRTRPVPFFVTREQHPFLWEALDTISHDGGARAGHSCYRLDGVLPTGAALMDEALKRLHERSKQEFEDFCIGEETDMERAMETDPHLGSASRAINRWFDKGTPCCCKELRASAGTEGE
jgi:hypothetical protein